MLSIESYCGVDVEESFDLSTVEGPQMGDGAGEVVEVRVAPALASASSSLFGWSIEEQKRLSRAILDSGCDFYWSMVASKVGPKRDGQDCKKFVLGKIRCSELRSENF